MKLQLRYKTDDEKNRMIGILSAAANVTKISEPYKSGKFFRVYIDIE